MSMSLFLKGTGMRNACMAARVMNRFGPIGASEGIVHSSSCEAEGGVSQKRRSVRANNQMHIIKSICFFLADTFSNFSASKHSHTLTNANYSRIIPLRWIKFLDHCAGTRSAPVDQNWKTFWQLIPVGETLTISRAYL